MKKWRSERVQRFALAKNNILGLAALYAELHHLPTVRVDVYSALTRHVLVVCVFFFVLFFFFLQTGYRRNTATLTGMALCLAPSNQRY